MRKARNAMFVTALILFILLMPFRTDSMKFLFIIDI